MPNPKRAGAKLEVLSSAFSQGQPIPVRYTCDGEDLSPPVNWSAVPDSSKSLALVCDDPDAPGGTWVHWLLYNIPPHIDHLDEGVPATATLREGGIQGKTSFGRIGYGGPCPPRGPAHRYFFKMYALDAELDLKPGATASQLASAMNNHVLAEGLLMGTYSRK
jgi:Raf kinase inhibitor-like YbhB/YbcL family protein